MDANFRLKSKLRSASTKDPKMGLGWAYFVDNAPYSEFLKDYVDQDEVSHLACSSLRNSKLVCICRSVPASVFRLFSTCSQKNRRVCVQQASPPSAVPTIKCFDHLASAISRKASGKPYIRSSSLHDAHYTNSYCNMDYIFTSSVQRVGLRSMKISYDVGCQWYINFWIRHNLLPPHLRLSFHPDSVRALVPEYHLQSHEEKCHSPFSFNYTKGCGRTDGEGVKRNWDELNGQAASTSEMTPGHRWETLDNCCRWVNFRKTMGLGM